MYGFGSLGGACCRWATAGAGRGGGRAETKRCSRLSMTALWRRCAAFLKGLMHASRTCGLASTCRTMASSSASQAVRAALSASGSATLTRINVASSSLAMSSGDFLRLDRRRRGDRRRRYCGVGRRRRGGGRCQRGRWSGAGVAAGGGAELWHATTITKLATIAMSTESLYMHAPLLRTL